jgi:cell division protein FtsQ
MKINRLKKGRKKNLRGTMKTGLIFLCVASTVILIAAFMYSHPLRALFPVNDIIFAGNRHLTDDELRGLAGISPQEGLLTISNEKILAQLRRSPWIRTVSMRKEFPGRIYFSVEEATPFALLDRRGHLFLIDDKGNMLEEMVDHSVPFLPIITGDPANEKAGFREALKLARLLSETGFTSERDHIEIAAREPNEILVTIDGIVVKIGAGEYEMKLERFLELEEDIKKLGTPIDYIDLRFEQKAVVKPISQIDKKEAE